MQVAVLERQTGDMMRGQERFKKKRDGDELMQKYYEQTGETPGGEPVEEEEEEKRKIDEEMQMIDEKIQEIEDFNKRNFKVDTDFLGLFQDLYDIYDDEILSAPFVEYSQLNRPPWYPTDFTMPTKAPEETSKEEMEEFEGLKS